jgi:hypothetical protein
VWRKTRTWLLSCIFFNQIASCTWRRFGWVRCVFCFMFDCVADSCLTLWAKLFLFGHGIHTHLHTSLPFRCVICTQCTRARLFLFLP